MKWFQTDRSQEMLLKHKKRTSLKDDRNHVVLRLIAQQRETIKHHQM